MKATAFVPALNPLPTPPSTRAAAARASVRISNFRAAWTCRLGERALGVDYGLRRVGLAVSVGVSPRVLPRVDHRNNVDEAARAVASAAVQAVCDTIVVGLPVDMHGREGEQVVATRLFMTALMACVPWARVVALDERLTTAEARDRLSANGVSTDMGRSLVDGVSAVILLERYFSDTDDIEGVVMQQGDGGIVQMGGGQAERKGFSDWKKETMQRAQESASQLHRKRNKRK